MNVKFNENIIETINNIKVYPLFINIKRFSDLVHGIYYYCEDGTYLIHDTYGTLYNFEFMDKIYPIATLHGIDYNDSAFDNIIKSHEIKNKYMLKQCVENALFDISINNI